MEPSAGHLGRQLQVIGPNVTTHEYTEVDPKRTSDRPVGQSEMLDAVRCLPPSVARAAQLRPLPGGPVPTEGPFSARAPRAQVLAVLSGKLLDGVSVREAEMHAGRIERLLRHPPPVAPEPMRGPSGVLDEIRQEREAAELAQAQERRQVEEAAWAQSAATESATEAEASAEAMDQEEAETAEEEQVQQEAAPPGSTGGAPPVEAPEAEQGPKWQAGMEVKAKYDASARGPCVLASHFEPLPPRPCLDVS